MDDKARLVSLYEQHRSCAKVGEIVGYGPEWVRKRLIAAGVTLNKRGAQVRHDIPEDELRELYQTMTMSQLAKYYGCGETTIWGKLKEYGIEHAQYGKFGHRHRPRVFSELHLQRMSDARKGKYDEAANGNWQGGISIRNMRARQTKEYRDWRVAALQLRGGKCQDCGAVDGYTCKCCGTRVRLHVHHVFSFARHPEKRFDPANSEVLCPECHWSRHRGKIG
jgi:5-methylcytosine-specific restriction endonuclease McrA